MRSSFLHNLLYNQYYNFHDKFVYNQLRKRPHHRLFYNHLYMLFHRFLYMQ